MSYRHRDGTLGIALACMSVNREHECQTCKHSHATVNLIDALTYLQGANFPDAPKAEAAVREALMYMPLGNTRRGP